MTALSCGSVKHSSIASWSVLSFHSMRVFCLNGICTLVTKRGKAGLPEQVFDRHDIGHNLLAEGLELVDARRFVGPLLFEGGRIGLPGLGRDGKVNVGIDRSVQSGSS